jgi:glycosyltransferase involved in cell wall biosynthesis
MTDVKKIMVLHGASWFVRPDLYNKLDIFYVRRAMPFYCRTADFLISNSDLTTRDFINILNVPEEKIKTVRLAQGESFHPVESQDLLESVKRKYSLPERFIVTVTSYDPRKNFATLISAFEKCREQENIHLVVVGKDCQWYLRDFDMVSNGLKEYVHFPGWIEQQDLPAIYSLASAFVFPSVYEEFGIPVVSPWLVVVLWCPQIRVQYLN